MAKTREIELGDGTMIPILYEDRSVLVIDKPAEWMLAPTSWDRTGRNLQRAIELSLLARDFWARSRNLKYLRFVHRLDADTSGVLLFAKSLGALTAFQRIFESRRMKKWYLAVVKGVPEKEEWVCRLALEPDRGVKGKMRAVSESAMGKLKRRGGSLPVAVQKAPQRRWDSAEGTPKEPKAAETDFMVLQRGEGRALVEARPVTGRTHQIRVHLAAGGHPVLGDGLYGGGVSVAGDWPLALRAVGLEYPDPFTGRVVHVEAPVAEFVRAFGFVRAKEKGL